MMLAPDTTALLADIATLQSALAELIDACNRAEADALLADLCADHAAARKEAGR